MVKRIATRIVENLKDRYILRNLNEPAPRQLTLDRHPAQDPDDDGQGMFTRKVNAAPFYNLYYENLCQLPDVHATVMQTELAAEINLTTVQEIARAAGQK
mgnify:FL=1